MEIQPKQLSADFLPYEKCLFITSIYLTGHSGRDFECHAKAHVFRIYINRDRGEFVISYTSYNTHVCPFFWLS